MPAEGGLRANWFFTGTGLPASAELPFLFNAAFLHLKQDGRKGVLRRAVTPLKVMEKRAEDMQDCLQRWHSVYLPLSREIFPPWIQA